MKIWNNSPIKSRWIIGFFVVFFTGTVIPMDLPSRKTEDIFVKTSDGSIVRVEFWQISQMKTLLTLLEHQQGENSYDNPLNALMIQSDELALLKFALRAAAEGVFEQYFMDLAKNDGLLDKIKNKSPQIQYTLGNGTLRRLVNAAEKVQAQGIVALCGSYYLPRDMQKIVAENIVNPVISFLKDQTIRIADQNIFTIGSEELSQEHATCCAFSHDSKKLYVGFYNGKVEVWDVAHKKLLKTMGDIGLHSVKQIALSADDTLCAIQLCPYNPISGEILIWDTSSGKLLHKYPNNIPGITTFALLFNPQNNNQIVFGYEGSNILPAAAFSLNIANGAVTTLIGYDEGIYSMCFSTDGTKILAKPYRFLDDIIIWDAASGNLEITIRPRRATYCSGANFYGSSDKIMIAGSSNYQKGQLIVEIGTINNNDYVMEKAFTCDRFFSPQKHDFGRLGFLAVPSFDGKKVALCSSYDMNALEYTQYGDKKSQGALLYIVKSDFSSMLLRTYLFKKGIKVVAWAHDDKWVAVTTNKNEIVVLPLLTEKNEAIVNQLPNLSIAQIRLLYQLYCGRLSGLRIGIKDTDKDNKIFQEIPVEIREFLSNYLFNDRPMGEEKCRGNECTIL